MQTPAQGELLVETEGLSKTFPETTALEALNLSVREGETVALLGCNGAGKTTVIHILLGLLTPTAGRVRLFGMDPAKQHQEIATHLNFSSAYVHLPSNLKVIENLRFFSKIYNVPAASERIAELMELLSLGPLRDRLTGSLSSGEKTRLNLAKSFLNRPRLLLLDEPTASLDPEMSDTVLGILKGIRQRENLGMLYTSHNMPEVEALCDRVLFLHKGKTIATGTPGAIKAMFQTQSLDQVFIRIVRGDLRDMEGIS